MAPSDSEDDNLEDFEYDGDDDPDADVDDEPLDGGADDATEEADDISGSEDSDDGSEEDEESEPPGEATMDVDPISPLSSANKTSTTPVPPQQETQLGISPIPLVPRKRSLSPAQLRKKALTPASTVLSSYTVEAICALPHPVPTHALASSFCMTHLLTGSDDGYIRDYDIFSAVNGKNFLSAPQRSHSSVVEGTMKSGQLRFWWENPPDVSTIDGPSLREEDAALSPVYSLAMHSDALWTLAGTHSGHVNLFTVRHEPGRLCHVMNGHRGPVSALSLDHDEKGYFSAGWDGEAIQWDLNTGQRVRNFTAHGSQLAGIAVRPETSGYVEGSPPVVVRQKTEVSTGSSQHLPGSAIASRSATSMQHSSDAVSSAVPQVPPDSDANSEASFDPLFDDEPDAPEGMRVGVNDVVTLPLSTQASRSTQPQLPHRTQASHVAPPKNAPPLLDPVEYTTYSPDVLMTAAIDGQIILWDKRVNSAGKGVGRLWMSEKTPPWCLSACWSADGAQLYAGRRNGTVDVWDVRQLGRSGPANTPRLLKTLRNPLSSGVVSCVVAFPDCRHIACASVDNLRLWNVADAAEGDGFGRTKSGAQFKIIPGHHGGYISQMIVNPAAKFLVSASSNRGWHGDSTRTVFIHDIKQHTQ